MKRLIDDISLFLEARGFEVTRQMRFGLEVISTNTIDKRHERLIMPLEINAHTPQEARTAGEHAYETVQKIASKEGYPLIIPEDRWKRQKEMMEARILAHLEIFSQAYARNCKVMRIEKAEAQEFLEKNHSYGDAACKYRYGLYLMRHTGHLTDTNQDDRSEASLKGKLIAVATFSNARKWIKDGKEIRSFEWTRYASLPDMRINGGMGKLLKAFIKDAEPDDIMSYADLEWSEGNVYKLLGFEPEERKVPVLFSVDSHWLRRPIRPAMAAAMEGEPVSDTGELYFYNFGSNKYRLKLTDYR